MRLLCPETIFLARRRDRVLRDGADLTTELVLRVSVLSRNKTSLQIRCKDAVEMPGFYKCVLVGDLGCG